MDIEEKFEFIKKHNPVSCHHLDTSLLHLPQSLEGYEVNIDPEYQRGHVWTKDQQEMFVGAFIENCRSIPPIVLNYLDNKMKAEVVDGKQRIIACLAFINGDITAQCPSGVGLHINEFEDGSKHKRMLNMSITMSWNFVELGQKEVMEYYLRLNGGGTIHTKKELDKVRKMIDEMKE